MVSTTVTVNVPVVSLPESSVAVHVTVVSPSGNTPGSALHEMATSGSASSVAIGASQVASAPAADVASTTTSAGIVSTGSVVSTTSMVTVSMAATAPVASNSVTSIVMPPSAV